MINAKTYRNLLIVTALAGLTMSCQTVPSEYGYGDPVKPMTTEERVQNAVRNAALEVSKATGSHASAVQAAETVYRANPKDPGGALNYAAALRKAGMTEQAQLILKPFALSPERSNGDILVEYSKIKLNMGDLKGAELFAHEALTLNPEDAASHNILGVAVDAQGYHQAAENHFRHALENVGDNITLRSAISNNLAMSLIAQKKYAEAKAILSGLTTPEKFEQDVIDANRSFVNSIS